MSEFMGGRAFPRSAAMDTGVDYAHGEQAGMLLRDYFAAAALPELLARVGTFELLARVGTSDRRGIAKAAYAMADALLMERGTAPDKVE